MNKVDHLFNFVVLNLLVSILIIIYRIISTLPDVFAFYLSCRAQVRTHWAEDYASKKVVIIWRPIYL